MVTKHKWRITLGGLSLLIASAAGVVTNIATDRRSFTWGTFLGVLTLCMIVIHIALSSIDREQESTRTASEGPRHRLTPTGEAKPAEGAVTIRVGRDLSTGVVSRHHVAVVLIVAAVGLAAPALTLLLTREQGAANAGRGSPAPAVTQDSSPASPRARIASTGPSTTGAGIPAGSDRKLRTFGLWMERGNAYDIDIGPNESTATNFGADPREPGDEDRELYLSGKSSIPTEWQLYMPQQPNRGVDPDGLKVVGSAGRQVDCRDPDLAGHGSSINANTAAIGDTACLRTTSGRWAMVTLLSLTERPGEKLHVKITLYA